MTTAALLPPPPHALPRDAAARWLAAFIAEFEAMQTLDGDLVPIGASPTPEEFDRAQELRAEWGRWAERVAVTGARIADDPALTDGDRVRLTGMIAHGRRLAKQDVMELRRRLERVDAGDFIDGEELRRELGLPRRR